MSLKIFVYENSSITFNDGDSLMVNATEMAKAFGKRPQHFLSTDQTKEFLEALSLSRNLGFDGLVVVEKGGANPGTWFHEDVAVEFARWLSPSFAIWCNDRIKELIKHGVTASPEALLNPDTMIAAMNQLKEARANEAFAKQQLKLAENTIQEQAPLVKYATTVLQSPDLIATNIIAADLGVSAAKLNKVLRENKIIYSQSGVNVLYSDYRNKGLADYKTHTYQDRAGQTHSVQHLYWTETGRRFLVERFAPQFQLSRA